MTFGMTGDEDPANPVLGQHAGFERIERRREGAFGLRRVPGDQQHARDARIGDEIGRQAREFSVVGESPHGDMRYRLETMIADGDAGLNRLSPRLAREVAHEHRRSGGDRGAAEPELVDIVPRHLDRCFTCERGDHARFRRRRKLGTMGGHTLSAHALSDLAQGRFSQSGGAR